MDCGMLKDNKPMPYVFSRETQTIIDASQDAIDTSVIHSKVTQRIEQLESEIQALKGCHNATTITCRLPIEILSNIFLFLPEFKIPWNLSYSWVQATHVCRHWRSIATNCASLWTTLDFSRAHPFLELLLERSKQAPLSVIYEQEHNTPDPSPLLTRALSRVDRVRSLNLIVRYKSSISSIADSLSQWTGSAAALEKLELQWRHTERLLPTNFLRGGVPKLCHLRLLGCDLHRWDTLPFGPSITVLHLSNDIETQNRPSPAEFFKSFSQMPCLRMLNLSHFLPSIETSPPTAIASPFIFLSLQILTVEDSPSYINHFLQLSQSQAVHSLNIALTETSQRMSESSIPELFDKIVLFLGQLKRGVKPHLRELLAADFSLVMEFDTLTPDRPSAKPANSIKLSLSIGDDEYLINSLLGILDEHFDLQNLTRLKTETEADSLGLWDIGSWRFFGRLPSLESLSFQGAELGMVDFLRVLQESIDSQVDAPSTPFPRLSTIILSSMWFEKRQTEIDFDDFFSALLSILKYRSFSPSPISELQIGMCEQLKKTHITTLRTRCPGTKIVWDEDT